MQATYHKYILNFKRPSGTSRGVLTAKETWFIIIKSNTQIGIGECGLLRGLSFDDHDDYEDRLKWVCDHISLGLDTLLDELDEFPSIQFGLDHRSPHHFYRSPPIRASSSNRAVSTFHRYSFQAICWAPTR